MNKLFTIITIIFVFFYLVSCKQKDPVIPSTPNLNSDVEFCKEDVISDLRDLQSIIKLEVVNDIDKINEIFDNGIKDISKASTFSEIRQIQYATKNKAYNLIPKANGTFDYSKQLSSLDRNISNLLINYMFRTHIMGIPYNDICSFNLNILPEHLWNEQIKGRESFQGKNYEYKPVNPLLANDLFLKGFCLAIDKTFHRIGATSFYYGDYKYYKHNIDLAKKYVKAALAELVESKVYNIENLEQPINIPITYIYPSFVVFSKYEESNINVLKSVEQIINCEEVTDNNFNITFDIVSCKNYGDAVNLALSEIYQISYSYSTPVKLAMYTQFSLYYEINHGCGFNYVLDTNDSDVECIVYNGLRYSYDAFLVSLINECEIKDGNVILNGRVDVKIYR